MYVIWGQVQCRLSRHFPWWPARADLPLSYTPVYSSAAYDNAGRLTAITDPVGLQNSLSYNAQGLVSQAVAPAQVNASSIPVVQSGVASQRKLSLAYSSAGDLSQITDAQGFETRLSTDSLGRPSGSTDALGEM